MLAKFYTWADYQATPGMKAPDRRGPQGKRSTSLEEVPESNTPRQKVKCGSPFFMVGLGASAGGLEALGTFFDAMPPDGGMAFVVIQHLSTTHRSVMAELLSRNTRMRVAQAKDGVTVRVNHVYLIPPNRCLAISKANCW